MSQANKALVVMVVAVMGMWGCAQENKKHGSSDPRVKALELKNAKLEEDFRAVVEARDALRNKLAALDQDNARLGKELEQLPIVVKERDELRQQVTVRSNERDSLQNQLEGLRSGLRNLLGQVEKTSGSNPAQAVTSPVKAQGDDKT
jgi:uncharacterized coiled-coil DUF342 family protein